MPRNHVHTFAEKKYKQLMISALVCYSLPVDWRWSKGGRGCENDPSNNDPVATSALMKAGL